MNIIDFNSICTELGWHDDVGYSMFPGPVSTFYNIEEYEKPVNTEALMISASVDTAYISKPEKAITKLSIDIRSKDELVDTREYSILDKSGWDNEYIKNLIKTISDMFVYLHIGPNLKNRDLDEMLESLGYLQYSDSDEAEDWYTIGTDGPVALYTYGLNSAFWAPHGVRKAKVIGTMNFDPERVYNANDDICLCLGKDYHWNCTYKPTISVEEIKSALENAHKQYLEIKEKNPEFFK